MRETSYTEPDAIEALYLSPDNEVLLAEFALADGAVQLGALPATLGASNTTPGLSGGGGDIVTIGGDTGGGSRDGGGHGELGGDLLAT
jgi:hypothetical protein